MNATNHARTSGAAHRTAFENAMRDNLSPEAIAMIVAYLQPSAFHRPANEETKQALREVDWFTDTLTAMLGVKELNRMMEELCL